MKPTEQNMTEKAPNITRHAAGLLDVNDCAKREGKEYGREL